jgi:hypothetical protein
VPKPQSLPAITFSRPTSLAWRPMRCAISSIPLLECGQGRDYERRINGSVKNLASASAAVWKRLVDVLATKMVAWRHLARSACGSGATQRQGSHLQCRLSVSVPITSVTIHAEDMGNTLASKGFGAHSRTRFAASMRFESSPEKHA